MIPLEVVAMVLGGQTVRPGRGAPETQRGDRKGDRGDGKGYPVVINTCVHYLGPPGPFSFPDSRDLLEVLRRTLLAERETLGRIP